MSQAVADAGRLVALVYVARHGSLTAAAKAMGVTTSAVSQQMAALESQCGVTLFDRHPRGVVLTGAGVVLLGQAEQLLRQIDETSTTMAQLSGDLAGRVRVAAVASGAVSIVLPAARVLSRSAPAVRMSVTALEPADSLEALSNGTADVALVDVYDHLPLALSSRLVVEELLSEPLVLVTARDSAVRRHPALSSLKDYDWVLPPPQAACGTATRYACREAGFEPHVVWETDDLLLLVAAVASGEGIALLPRRAVADSVAAVEMHRLADPILSRRLLLVARQGTVQRPVVQACLDAMRHVALNAPNPRPYSGAPSRGGTPI